MQATLSQWSSWFCSCSHGLQLPWEWVSVLPWLRAPQAVQCVGERDISLFFLTLPPSSVCLSLRLKNLPFTFTKLKDLAALWLSDNQVCISSRPLSERLHLLTSMQHKHTLLLYIRIYQITRPLLRTVYS